ncbi:hypothetical protein GJ744_005990 [Endocarpon pusillum]|uniref:Bicarbonate transporter-like transmembrane domain-containing protein n=1 Tax=Endocarpon pusillum TaxID=364733 RepID=A0A8H7A7H1_9EURO|nr:hypothetical protein GJ744_005990 [Endocarpon pusillum]
MLGSMFAGVFFVVGWGSIESNGILRRLVWLVREPRFIQPNDPLLTVRRSKIGLFLFRQILGVAATVAISQTIAAIGFPVPIIALIPLRWKLLPKMFTTKEMSVLDALTADNEVVLASLGGKPGFRRQRMTTVAVSWRGGIQPAPSDSERVIFTDEGKAPMTRK